MIKTVLSQLSRTSFSRPFIRSVTMSEMSLTPEVTSSEEVNNASATKNGDVQTDGVGKQNGDSITNTAVPGGDRPEYKWKKSKKMAAMISFSGKDYLGMQRNVGFKTIEGELLDAFSKSGFIDPEWVDNPQKAFFQRASRTDKGVSALKMIVSLKLTDEEGLVDKVNACLPSDIRLQAVVRVTKNFNCKSAADARTYIYLLPTFAFSPATEIVSESWRCEPDTVKHVNSVFSNFIGSHYFHNYTSGKLPLEPSSRRHIYEFESSEPFMREGMEWCLIKVKGQSFMLHQIRKMIGMGIAIIRGHTDVSKLEETWGMERIDIPRAPGLGLILEEIHYDRYNVRYGSDGIHDPLSWEKVEPEVESFKQDFVFSDIVQTEKDAKSMFEWMSVLPMHKFLPRHFEEDGHQSPLQQAEGMVRRDTNQKAAAAADTNQKAAAAADTNQKAAAAADDGDE